MTLPLEEDSRPPYLQAAEVLRSSIRGGEYAPGTRLPSARVLQERFGVASSTVQNALRVLKRENLVYSVVGRGSYVCHTSPALLPSAPGEHLDRPAVPGDEHRQNDARPPYVRVSDVLRQEIRSGALVPGDRLPAARELQERFSIANSTAQNAVRVLKREGLAYAIKGKGVFVRSTPPAAQPRVVEEPARRPGAQGNTVPPDRVPTDDETVAALAAAEQRLARAAVAYTAARTEVELLTREARRRGLLPSSGVEGSEHVARSTAPGGGWERERRTSSAATAPPSAR
ncbi:GntR family transcriptional regulator [Streptomyces sp. NPDC046985]|uniref:GntR family transcriptional regulator n=1 Tax=Streptomyces sp. NPDC046985 TaxID=3155377 RepID=UPI003408F464